MSGRKRLLACLLVINACNTTRTQPVEPASTLTWKPCQLKSPMSSTREAAECATLIIDEPHATLSVARLPATSGDTSSDPVLFIPGGPGQSARESFVTIAPAFARVGMHRDIVMLDPRGTNGSEPLHCDALKQLEASDDAGQQDDGQQTDKLIACLAQLTDQVRQVSTQREVADLEALRRALGVSQVNLYGASYGSRVALEYLRTHPDRVRSMVLDGVVAQDTALGGKHAQHAEAALEALFARCEQTPRCQQAFPALRQAFLALKEQVRRQPVVVRVSHPKTARETTVRIDTKRFEGTVRLALYSPETAALLPRVLWQAHHDKAWEDVARFALVLASDVDKVVNPLVNYAVLCREDVPFYASPSSMMATAKTTGSPFFTGIHEDIERVCAKWPVAAERLDRPAVRSSVPTLLLSGEHDPVTPPSEAERTLKTLSNARHLVVPHAGHIVIARGCAPRVVGDFFRSADVQALKTDCLDSLGATPIFTDVNGP